MSSLATICRSVQPVLGGAVLALLLVPAASFAQEKQKIVVTGASTIAPLMTEIAHRYEQASPTVIVNVQSGGTSRGISDVRRKLADIGMVSRALFREEHDVTAILIARDGVALIVHKSNPIAELTDEQIRQIYRGEVTNWKAFGGPDAPIIVVNKAEGRSTLDVFLSYIKLSNKDIKAHVVVGDNEQVVKLVLGNPRSIGYVSIGTAEYHIADRAQLKMIPFGSVPPSTTNVANGTYAASRELNLVSFGSLPPHVTAFLTFATSEKNHDLVRDYYFVPPAK
jgi:phosphate transport system substrate-binding protein